MSGLIGVIVVVTATAVVITACGRSDRSGKHTLSKRVVPLGQPVPKGGGRYKVGNPYQVNGKWYHPKEYRQYDRVGRASWYGEMFHGRYTANGEIYDMTALSAAHPTLPMPVHARVTNLSNGRSIVVRINDRGPYARERIIDLSRRSAEELGFKREGTAPVRVTYLGKAPIDGDDSYERRYLAARQKERKYAMRKRKRQPQRTVAQAPLKSLPKRNPNRAAAALAARKADPTVTAAFSKSNPKRRRVSTATPPGLVFVQAGSFRSSENADKVKTRLAKLGRTQVFPAEIGGKMYYRVRLGPYADRRRADAVLGKVVEAGSSGAQLVTR